MSAAAVQDLEYLATKKRLAKLWKAAAPDGAESFADVAEKIEGHFNSAIRQITANDIAYVLGDRGDRTLRTLNRTMPPWAKPQVKQTQLLLQLLRDVMAGKARTSWKSMSAITATMLYLMNPLDILPNFLPGIGHIDDALVIALCFATVRKDMVRYARQNDIDLEEFTRPA